MDQLATHHAFTAYVITAIVLCLNILGLWGYSGGVRVGTKTAINPEDIRTVAKDAALLESDPPEVARVLRAHRNATDNIVPFLILGYLYVQIGASSTMAMGIFGVFTAMRLLHTFSYLKGVQPWRTISFALGGVTTLVMIGDMIRHLLT